MTKGNKYQSKQFCGGFVLKLTDFRLASLSPLYHGDSQDADLNKFTAPEVDLAARNSGLGYQPISDVWGVGLVLYFLATGGLCPFESFREANQLAVEDKLLGVLDRHGLHERLPMLHDLIERTIRVPQVSDFTVQLVSSLTDQ